MTLAHVAAIIPDPDPPVERVWGARTDDRSYRVDCTVQKLACEEVPDWLVFGFAGAGGLAPLAFFFGASTYLLTTGRGFQIVRGELTEITSEEFHALVPAPVTVR